MWTGCGWIAFLISDPHGRATPPATLQARVVSLPQATRRRALVEDNLRDLPLPWQFFDALRGDAVSDIAPDASRQARRFGRPLAANEIGCFKSHVALLGEFARDPTLEWLLVLEDDVWVDTAFDFADITARLTAAQIDYLRLYARRWKAADVVQHWGERQLLRFRTDPYGTQAYLISRAGARRFIASLHSIDMPIDDELGRFWVNGLEIYAVFPFPVIERSLPSSLAGTRQANPIRASSFTWRRHLDRLLGYAMKARSNLAFRMRQYFYRSG